MTVKPILLAFALWPGLCAQVSAAPDCSVAAETVRLAGVDERGDPVLADGRRLRLVGLAPRQDASEADRFARAIVSLSDRDWHMRVLSGSDRWGRLPARLRPPSTAEDAQTQDLAAMLQQMEAARPLAEPLNGTCRTAVRATAPVGTPARTVETVIDGHDIAAMKAQAGRLVWIEGRIASVGERTQRTYLNFSRRRGEAAAIVLSRGLWREMREAGWTATGLSGKRLRAQGILSGRDGLLLDVTSKDALELID